MICGNCGSWRVEWKGPLSNLTHTECADCGATNCQTLEIELDEPDEDSELKAAQDKFEKWGEGIMDVEVVSNGQ